jgi:co-chaperonin GroES (HSP10)
LYYNKEEWKSHSKYCFIKPIPPKKSFLGKTGKEEPLVGVVKYNNQELKNLGVKVGDEVSFTPESEYEFYVEDEKLYRMFTDNITMIM